MSINVRTNEAIDHGCNWNDGYAPYSELETATSRGIICCYNLLLRSCKNRIYSYYQPHSCWYHSAAVPSNCWQKLVCHELHVCMSQV